MSKKRQEITPTKAALGAGLAYLAWRWWRYGADGIFPSYQPPAEAGQSELSAALQRLAAQSSQGQAVNVYVGSDGSTYAARTPPPSYPPTKLIEAVEKIAGPSEYQAPAAQYTSPTVSVAPAPAPAPAPYRAPAPAPVYYAAPAPAPAYESPTPAPYVAPATTYAAPAYEAPTPAPYVAPAPAYYDKAALESPTPSPYVAPAPAPTPAPYVAPAPTLSEKMAYDKFGTTTTATYTNTFAKLAGFEEFR